MQLSATHHAKRHGSSSKTPFRAGDGLSHRHLHERTIAMIAGNSYGESRSQRRCRCEKNRSRKQTLSQHFVTPFYSWGTVSWDRYRYPSLLNAPSNLLKCQRYKWLSLCRDCTAGTAQPALTVTTRCSEAHSDSARPGPAHWQYAVSHRHEYLLKSTSGCQCISAIPLLESLASLRKFRVKFFNERSL